MHSMLDERKPVTRTLGQYLASIRQDRGLTLRDVETKTDKEVSNAYLSQIENDKIKKPSPNVLHALAGVYKISYEQLMQMAGYVVSGRADDQRHGRIPTFAEHNLTEEEEAKLIEYLQFIRSRK
jgi:transcriptional regulator with XRE-family HTH domain